MYTLFAYVTSATKCEARTLRTARKTGPEPYSFRPVVFITKLLIADSICLLYFPQDLLHKSITFTRHRLYPAALQKPGFRSFLFPTTSRRTLYKGSVSRIFLPIFSFLSSTSTRMPARFNFSPPLLHKEGIYRR